jgi:hypothetical protein
MTFRVGLLFVPSPNQPFVAEPVLDLLQKVVVRSTAIRKDQQPTLVPFIRTREMAVFSRSMADTAGYAVEAAAFDDGGVTFGSLDAFAQANHLPYDHHLDFDLGMKVLLARCEVIVIVCLEAELSQMRERLIAFRNISVLLALVANQKQLTKFVEVDSDWKELDGPSWLLAIQERWAAPDALWDSLPDRKRTLLGFLFPVFNSALIRRRSETIKKRKPSDADQCQAGMGLSVTATKKLSPADNDLLQLVLDAICPHFLRHDELGRHYSNAFRTTCLMVPLFIVASTILAVLASIDTTRQDVWHLSEGILLIAAVALFSTSTIGRYHRKWVEHRLLTELLRSALLNTFFHTLPSLTPPSEEPKLWIDRSQILLRHLRKLPTVTFNSPTEDLRSARISALDDYSSYQATWHTDFADQHRTAQKRLIRLSAVAFALTLLFCILQLVVAFLIRQVIGHPEILSCYQRALATTEHLLLMGTLVFAGGAFVLLILSHQLGFEAIAERSSNAAEHFRELQTAISQRGYVVDSRQVYAWANTCFDAILAEQHSWYRQIPLIRMHL